MQTHFKHHTETRKQIKSRRDRLEANVKAAVRAACVERDGYCKLAHLGGCKGPSEWAHLGEWRRCFTRGQHPVERHHARGSFMACRAHHRAYDAGEFELLYGESGANGTLTALVALCEPNQPVVIKAKRDRE